MGGAWKHKQDGTIVNHRRGSADGLTFPAIQHGDTYELFTADPHPVTGFPLPYIRFLQIRYAVQKLLAGAMGSAGLQDMFGDSPPENQPGPTRGEAFMPSHWENLLKGAQEIGILDSDAADKWRKAVMEDTYRAAKIEANIDSKYMALMARIDRRNKAKAKAKAKKERNARRALRKKNAGGKTRKRRIGSAFAENSGPQHSRASRTTPRALSRASRHRPRGRENCQVYSHRNYGHRN
ncbi:hypothetical protein B0H67DRAFT_656540 [Lasiosphaeris hirsuta]|uniref:Uncharacterized protein n=1 Tax=Lasiosphaeris hirsuta TaxID=260670 RepID=A0AA40AYA0_9PEZI|nr:hypothetical protein B0H67DRAFT_656540 [Lasiosphaeris hirsuta]